MAVLLSGLDVTAYDREGDTYRFFTNDVAVLRITAVSEKTMEIWVDFDGKGERIPSYSISNMPEGSSVPPALSDREDHYLLVMGACALRIYKKGLHLEFVSEDDRAVILQVVEIGRDEHGTVFVRSKISPDEHFYGLGEDNDGYLGSLDRRGHTRDMVTGQRINIGKVTADIPVTFYMSTGGTAPYGIFTDDPYPMFYDMGSEKSDECLQRASGGDLIFYYFRGDDFAAILNEYTDLTGKPPIPPLWTQGYIQCRCSYWNWEQIDELIAKLRKYAVPLDCIVFDYDWAEYFNNYKWSSRWQGRSPERIAHYRAQGIHFMVSNSGPMLKKNADTYESALAAGILARDSDGKTITCGHYGGDLMDFSHPSIKDWLRPQLERILDDGVESWWLDLTEPEGDPENTRYHGGERNRIHNVFSLLTARTYFEITREYDPGKRSFILTRTGTAGIQKYCTAIWSGDVYSDYKTFRAHIPEALNTAMSGIPMWTSDAGGFISASNNDTDNRHIYRNDVARHANLYERWVQFACFSPLMRVHHAGESAPYAFGELMTSSIAHYIRLRYRLLPYVYSYAYRTYLTGEPLIRPLVFHYPNDENVFDLADEYLFGREILVAPVYEEEVCKRKVYFPAGRWVDLDYGHEYEGGSWHEVYAPQNRIPVFVRAGAIIPVADGLENTSQWDRGVISVQVYPYGKSCFTHYCDDGVSLEYENGVYTLTELSCEEDVGARTIIRTVRSNDHFPAKSLHLKVYVNAVPHDVTVNGITANRQGHISELDEETNGWFYDDFSRVLTVKAFIPSAENEIAIIYKKDSVFPRPSKNCDNTPVSGQCPFILPAASVPCHIGFENFDRGGEGIAYHKERPDNIDSIYRCDDVRIDNCDDIGCGVCVEDLRSDEWLEYTVNVLEQGTYFFKLRLRAEAGSRLNILSGERVLVKSLDVSGDRWHDICSDEVSLEAGEQTIRFHIEHGTIDGNWFDIDHFAT